MKPTVTVETATYAIQDALERACLAEGEGGHAGLNACRFSLVANALLDGRLRIEDRSVPHG